MLGGSSSHVTSLRSPISFQYCLCHNRKSTNTNRNPLHCFDCDKSKGLVKAGSTKYLDVSFVNPASPTEITARHTDSETDAASAMKLF